MTLQDFSVVKSYLEKIKEDNELEKLSDAFYFMALEEILDISDDEIYESITDNSFLNSQGQENGHDRGIDAIYIEEKGRPIVHFFNCKYTDKYNKAADSNFPSNEIDKIAQYLEMMMQQDHESINSSNPAIKTKTEEIWSLFEKVSPKFELHFCANYEKGLQPEEQARLDKVLRKYSDFSYKYHNIYEFTRGISGRDKQVINGQFRTTSDVLFERSDGEIRALIASVNAGEILRLLSDNDEYRETLELPDEVLNTCVLCEDAFNDNVRVYQTQKSRINKAIAQTALSDEGKSRFFYYNNGITMTCKKFTYPKGNRFPIVKLEDVQVVNGGQTIHALYEVLNKSIDNVEQIRQVDLLCRIYELQDPEYSSRIAEYTNSQNPVTTRDIRSIDIVQQNLETEFLTKGLYYERKKQQYKDQPKKKRIDAELAGQCLMAYFCEMPSEAKNDKKMIFGEKYEYVFPEDMVADKILLVHKLYQVIENHKKEYIRSRSTMLTEEREQKSYIPYVSFFLLYTLGQLANELKIESSACNYEAIANNLESSLLIIEKAIAQERKNGENYSHSKFFKSARAKKYIDDFIRRCDGDFSTDSIIKKRTLKK